jgi:hypothetical protein
MGIANLTCEAWPTDADCLHWKICWAQRCKPVEEKVELEPTKLQNSKEVGEENHVSGARTVKLPSVREKTALEDRSPAMRFENTKWDPITDHH